MKCVCVCVRETDDRRCRCRGAVAGCTLCVWQRIKKEGASMRCLASESVRSLCDDDGDVQKPSVVIKHG